MNERRQWTRWLLGAIAFGLVSVSVWRSMVAPHHPSGPRPNVVLIVLDTVRADRLGTYGNTKRLTPFLDQLATESLVYQQAHAPTSWTTPSVASMFLAKQPSEHQVITMHGVLPEHEITLAEVLRDHGYRTGGFSANLQVRAESGFGQGFETFEFLMGAAYTTADATQLNEAALEWLESLDPAAPFFLYLQYMEAHTPYDFHPGITPEHPSGLAADDAQLSERVNTGAADAGHGDTDPWQFTEAEVRRLIELYDGEIAYLDQRLAELFTRLEERNALTNSIVVVTADHGEEFGEHQHVFAHGVTLFEPAIHVPLIVRLPGQPAARVGNSVQLAGLAPALLRTLGIGVPETFVVPPLPLMGSAPKEPFGGAAYAEIIKSQPKEFRLHRQAIVHGTHKLLLDQDGTRQYYDLAADPQEQRPAATAPYAGTLDQALNQVVEQLGTPTAREVAPLDDATRERLRGLGYAE